MEGRPVSYAMTAEDRWMTQSQTSQGEMEEYPRQRLSLCKGPGARRAWVMEEQRRGCVAEAEGTRGTEGGGRRGGDRQVVQGPVGCREDLGFEPGGGRSHGGLWAGEGGPDVVFTGALLYLMSEGQTVRGEDQGPEQRGLQ
jgi:hypothetical protein